MVRSLGNFLHGLALKNELLRRLNLSFCLSTNLTEDKHKRIHGVLVREPQGSAQRLRAQDNTTIKHILNLGVVRSNLTDACKRLAQKLHQRNLDSSLVSGLRKCAGLDIGIVPKKANQWSAN
jgi:hypothetical protein